MSKHKIGFIIDLSDFPEEDTEKVLLDLRVSMILHATEHFGVKEYYEGQALGMGGHEGPFITNIHAMGFDT